MIFSATVLKDNTAHYYHCPSCGFLQVGDPCWLEQAYQESISVLDTGIMQRNLHLARASSVILYFLFNRSGAFLDFAGGYGMLTRMMRDIASRLSDLEIKAVSSFISGLH